MANVVFRVQWWWLQHKCGVYSTRVVFTKQRKKKHIERNRKWNSILTQLEKIVPKIQENNICFNI